MTRGQVVVLLLFLALLGGGALLLGPRLVGRPGPGRTSPGRGDDGRDDDGRRGEGAKRGGEEGLGERPPSREPALPRVRLHVVGPDGPIERARLRFSGAQVASAPEAAEVEVVRERALAWVGAEGLAWARLPAPSATGEAVRVALEAAAEPFTLRVLEPDGTPAVGVAVVGGAWGPDAGEWRTDAEGRIRVEGRPPGVATLRVGGTERTGPWVRIALGTTTEAVATLDPARVVEGRVVGPDGAPIAGAEVAGVASTGPVGLPTSTREDGTFRWTGPLTAGLALRVSASGLAPVSVEPPWPDAGDTSLSSRVEVALEVEAARLDGSLALPAGGTLRREDVVLTVEPAVAEVLREIYGSESVIAAERRVDVGDDGRFSLPGPRAGVPLRLRVRGAVEPEDHLLVAGARRGPLRLEPLPAPPEEPAAPDGPGRVEGRVVDDAGNALPGVSVVGFGRSVTTDVDGRFVLPGLDAGVRRAQVVYGWFDGARPKGFLPAEFVVGGRADVRTDAPASLVLPRASRLSLRLVDPQGRPLSWAHLVVVDGDGWLRFDEPVAASDGRATLEGLEPGTAGTLHAFAPGLRRAVAVTLVPGKASDLGDVRLMPEGRVVGEVRRGDGSPVEGAVVAEVEDAWVERATRDRVRERDRVYRRVRTGADGSFVLEGLDASRPTALAVWAPGHAPAPRRVLWATGPEATLKATLRAGATLRARISDPAGVPVSGAVVDLEEAHTGTHLLDLWRRGMFGESVGSTDEMREASRTLLFEDPEAPGRYRLGPVEPGPYELWIERPGFRAARKRLTVPDDSSEGEGAPLRRVAVGSIEVQVTLEPDSGAAPAPAPGIGIVR